MPPLIDPFDLSPGNHQKAMLYWYCTWFRTVYRANASTWLDQLMPMVGGVDKTIWPEVLLPLDDRSPRIEVMHLADGRAVAHFRGSTSTGQIMQQILRSQLVPAEPWEGFISSYFRDATRNAWDRAGGQLGATQWMSCGHSLGGAMAGLISVNEGCQGVVTAAQPREGDGTYAASRDDDFKLRVVSWGDAVSKIPPTTNTFMDRVPGILFNPIAPITPGFQYSHWGIPLYYTSVGRSSEPFRERATATELYVYLIGLADGAWNFDNHIPSTYAFNMRRDIPVRFPASGPDFQFPGVQELDVINSQLNEEDGIEWPVDGRDSANLVDLLRQFIPNFSVPSITELIEHTSIEPFSCED